MRTWTLTAALLAGALLVTQARADEDAADLAAATRLPMRADSLRSSGVSSEDVSTILEGAQQQGMHPDEAAEVLQATEEAVRSGKGPVDNLGSYVRSQVEAGLRGQELAAAIKAEKERRGQGKPDHANGGGKPEDAGGGKPEDAGGGKPEDAGGGKPEDAGGGKPADVGGGSKSKGKSGQEGR